MDRDPGASDDKGKRKDLLPLTDEIPFTIGRDLKGEICLTGSSSSRGPSDDMSGVSKCDIKRNWKLSKAFFPGVTCYWEEQYPELRHLEKLHQELREKLREKLRWEKFLRTRKSECFVQGPPKQTDPASKHAAVLVENINSPIPGCFHDCDTCGKQSPTLQAFIGCHGHILTELQQTESSPVRASPGCRPRPHSCDPTERVCPIEVKSKMHDHVSRGECDGLAPVDTTIDIVEHEEMCDLQARLHRSLRGHGNDFGEGTSTMHSPISLGTSPSGRSDGLIHEHARSIPLQGGRLSTDRTAKLTESHSKCETWDLQARGGHGPDRLEQTLIIRCDESGLNRGKARPSGSPEYDGPTMRNVSGKGTSTMLNPGSSGVVIGLAHGLTHTVADTETGVGVRGGTPSSDRVQGGQASEVRIDSLSSGSAQENGDSGTGGTRFSDRCPVHGVCEDKWQSNTVDPLVAVIFQGICSLAVAESSSRSSLARDVLFYAIVFDCVLGFLFAVGGKWLRCAKMEGIGLLAAALGFLMTMALFVIYKIG